MSQQHFSRLIVTIALLTFAMISVNTVQVQAEFGTDWTGSFYNSIDLSGNIVYTQVFPLGLNVNWGVSGPAPGTVNEDNWSARFESIQYFKAATYEFIIASDDGVRVFIDNVLVLDRWVGRTLTTDRFEAQVTAGAHALRVEYFEGIDQAALQFQWFLLSENERNVTAPNDGRINTSWGDLAAVFPGTDSTGNPAWDVYVIDAQGHGTFAFQISSQTIQDLPDGHATQVISQNSVTVYLLEDNSLLFRIGPDSEGKYTDLIAPPF